MKNKLTENPIHLGLDATSTVEPRFSGLDWYVDYAERHASDGKDGRLVSTHTFDKSWDTWEAHPHGSEVVLCLSGEITLIQKLGQTEKRIELKAGDYAINSPGVWHTADVLEEATALFITSGKDTKHKKREVAEEDIQ